MAALRPEKLTVRIVKRTLGDHYLDFMNANNSGGYSPDDLMFTNIRRTKAAVPEAVHAGERLWLDLWNWDMEKPLPETYSVFDETINPDALARIAADSQAYYNIAAYLIEHNHVCGPKMLRWMEARLIDVRPGRVIRVPFGDRKVYMPIGIAMHLKEHAKKSGGIRAKYKLEHPEEFPGWAQTGPTKASIV